ncbi:MAG: Hsp20/alpha crystallin family protein [Magnetococcales bacterium]|nr:Hsp20/alpha crystallin family protein [Magnetococcales bacterium]
MLFIKQDPMHNNQRMIQNEINRLFEEGEGGCCAMTSQWQLRVDVHEDSDAYYLQADVPGMTQDQIKIHVENNQLTIAGERRLENEEQRDAYHRIERAYGSFSRTFQLSGEVDLDRIQATCKNGELVVCVPKNEGAKPRSIDVQVH